jgi:hypothetical protein
MMLEQENEPQIGLFACEKTATAPMASRLRPQN